MTDSRNSAFANALFSRLNATRIYTWLGGVSLLFLVFLVPPFQVPDEPQHFFRSYQLSKLEVWSRVQDGTSGSELPASLPELVEHFMGSTELHTKRVIPSQRLIDTFAELQRPLDPGRTVFLDISGIQSYAPLPYIPQALAIAAGRAFDVGPLGLLYMGRLANAFVAALITGIAISLFPVGRTFALLVALLPMTQFMTASVSPDALIIASALLFTAVLARFLTDGRWPMRCQLTGFVSGLVMCIVKPVYLPLLFAGLGGLFGGGRFANGAVRRIILSQLAAAAVTILLIALWRWSVPADGPSGPPVREGVNAAGQLAFLAQDPLRALGIFARSLYWNAEYLAQSMIGFLGWVNLPLPTWVYVVVALAFPASACAEPRAVRFSLVVAAWLLLVTFAVVPPIELALYLSWNPVGAPAAGGVQGRYFIPALPMLGVAIAATIGQRVPLNISGHAYLCVVVILVGVTTAMHVAIIQGYQLF